MFETLFPLSTDVGLLILRLGFAFVFILHGWPKLNPGGPMKGPAGFAGFLKQMGVPLPMLFAWIVALVETIGAGLVILGLATRLLALAFAVIMVVAIWAKRRFMKVGFTAQQATGWELDFVLLTASLTFVFTGPGALALDPLLGF
jgi:putative oxidoreductase